MSLRPELAGIAYRIRQATARGGGKQQVVLRTGIKSRTLGNYLSGASKPSAIALQALADACNVSVDWILSGPDDDPAFGLDEAKNYSKKNAANRRLLAPAIDAELFGRVVDAIQRLYKDQRVSLAPIDLGRIAARKYGEIVAATDDTGEQVAMIKLVVAQLRADILSAATEPGTGKASA